MKIAALIIAVVIAVALLWNASESHYRACVERAALLNPPQFSGSFQAAEPAGNSAEDYWDGKEGARARVGGSDVTKEGKAAVNGCSRLPL